MKKKDQKDILSNRQATIIVLFYLLGTSTILSVAKGAGKEAPLAILTASLLTIPIYFLYSRLIHFFPNKRVYVITTTLLGKPLGILFTLIYSYNTIFIISLSLRIIIDFIQTASLTNTNFYAITLAICAVIIIVVKNSLNHFGKFVELFFIFISFSLIFAALLIVPDMNPDQLIPLFYDGYDDYITFTFAVFAFPFLQTSTLVNVLSHVESPEKTFRILLKALLIATIILMIVSMESIMSIGANKYKNAIYPVYLAARRVDLGKAIQRIELNIMLTFITMSICKIIGCLYSALMNFSDLFQLKRYECLTVPTILLCGVLAFLMYETTLERDPFFKGPFIIYSLCINLLLPFILYTVLIIRKKIIKNL